MQIRPDKIKIVMTAQEASILLAVVTEFDSEDTYGSVSETLNIPIEEVVNTVHAFADPIKRMLA